MLTLSKIHSEEEYRFPTTTQETIQRLLIFRKGSMTFRMKGRLHVIEGPAVINHSPLVDMALIEGVFPEAYVVSFSKKAMESLVAHSFLLLCPMTGVFHMKLKKSEFSTVEDLLFMMSDPSLTEDILSIQTLLLVKYLSRYMNDGNSQRISDNELVKQYVGSVDKKHEKQHQVNLYADQLGVSTRTLNRIFKESTGITPKESLNYRLNLSAKQLLLEKRKSVKEISFLLGFSSPEYFHSFFRKNNGLAPGEYRSVSL